MTDLRQAAQQVVSEQAEDEGLWFAAATASEAYLQQALRRLHAAVEQQPRPEQQQARVDVITVTLMREGINKHKARELADHFVNFTLTPALPVQEPVQSVTDEKIKACLDAADQMYCEHDGDKELFMTHAVLAAHNIGAKP